MIQAFHNVRFPTAISRKSAGGPERRTEVVTLGSGHEQRNARWSDSRRRYNAGIGVTTLDELHQVIAFFEERRGRLHAFRWKDHADFRSGPPSLAPTATDQVIGAGDGATSDFQLIKTYGDHTNPWPRLITKPIAASVRVAVDGGELAAGTDFTVDDLTGMLTLTVAPPTGAEITAGFEFDVPVRFADDRLSINLAAFSAGAIPEIELVEVRQ